MRKTSVAAMLVASAALFSVVLLATPARADAAPPQPKGPEDIIQGMYEILSRETYCPYVGEGQEDQMCYQDGAEVLLWHFSASLLTAWAHARDVVEYPGEVLPYPLTVFYGVQPLSAGLKNRPKNVQIKRLDDGVGLKSEVEARFNIRENEIVVIYKLILLNNYQDWVIDDISYKTKSGEWKTLRDGYAEAWSISVELPSE